MRRLTRSRRPWLRVAIFAVVVGVLAAVVTPVYWNLSASPERLHWTVVGAGRDGRSLVITTTKDGGTCGEGDYPRAHLEKDTASEIRIRVVYHDPLPLGRALFPFGSYACAGVGLGPSRFTIKLQHRLAGQTISGPAYRPRLAGRRNLAFGLELGARNAHASMVSVVGLRLDDARRVMRSVGILVPMVTGPDSGNAVVTAQAPPAGTPLEHDPQTARRGRRGIKNANTASVRVRSAGR